jgi:hypothetical protein
MLSQDAEVGVKCKWKRGLRLQPVRIPDPLDAAAIASAALRVNPGFFDLQAGEHLGLALALSLDVSTFAPLLVSDRHSSDWPAKPRRFIDGRIDWAIRRSRSANVDSGSRVEIRRLRFFRRGQDLQMPCGRGGRA